MKKTEDLPEKLLDLLEQKAFKDLTLEEKSFVLNYLSGEDYASLHQAAKASRKHYESDKDIVVSAKVSANIMHGFSSRKNEYKGLQSASIKYWRAAAALLLLVSSVLGYFSLKPNQVKTELVYVPIHDTVFMEKAVQEKAQLADTLPPVKTKKVKSSIIETGSLASQGEEKRKPQELLNFGLLTSDIHTISPSEISDEIIKWSGKTMNEDSLLRYFRFAGI